MGEGAVDQINEFIEQRSGSNFSIDYDLRDQFYGILFLGAFLEAIAIFLFSAKSRLMITIDQEAGILAIQTDRFFKLWQTSERQWDLKAIHKFSTQTLTSTGISADGIASAASSTGLIMKLKSGENIAIANTFDSRGGKDQLAIFLTRFLKQD